MCITMLLHMLCDIFPQSKYPIQLANEFEKGHFLDHFCRIFFSIFPFHSRKISFKSIYDDITVDICIPIPILS